MSGTERLRWLDLLSYIHALVAHEREPNEQQQLSDTIEDSVQTDPHHYEVMTMKKTIADSLIEKGAQQGHERGALETRQTTLLRLLTKRFGNLPADIRTAIEKNREPSQLDEWLDGVVTARSLQNLGIR